MTVELVKTSWSQIGKYCRIPFLRLLSPYLTLHSIVLSLNTFLVKSLRVLYMSLVVYRNIAHTWPLTGKTKQIQIKAYDRDGRVISREWIR